jgi:flagellar protein FlaG
LILFIAALTVALGVSTTLMSNVQDISHSIGAKGDGVTETIETDVEIISDPGSPSAVYDNSTGNVTLLIKNTGQKTLAADGTELDILVDGEYAAIADSEVVGSPAATTWQSGDVLRVTVTKTLDAGSHRVTVHANGDTAELRFRID